MPSAYVTDQGRFEILKKDPTSLTLRAVGVTTPPANQSAANSLVHTSDIVANELSVPGYSRQTLSGLTATQDNTNHWAKFASAAFATWSAVATGQNFQGLWIVERVGGGDVDASDLLICFLGCASTPTNGGDLTPTEDANGILTLT